MKRNGSPWQVLNAALARPSRAFCSWCPCQIDQKTIQQAPGLQQLPSAWIYKAHAARQMFLLPASVSSIHFISFFILAAQNKLYYTFERFFWSKTHKTNFCFQKIIYHKNIPKKKNVQGTCGFIIYLSFFFSSYMRNFAMSHTYNMNY